MADRKTPMSKPSGEKSSVLVALSGGPDSVALLHLLHEQAKANGGKVLAAHVNYRLRGDQSDGDERFCRELCRRLKVRLFVKRVKPGDIKKGNVQAQARKIRYRFFEEVSARHGIERVAIGHNKSDNAETFLMNLGRGAGTFGLGRMRQPGNVIRPLLGWTRSEIEAYLKRQRLSYRVDESNLADKYLRNRVRKRLLPAIAEVLGEKSLDAIDRSGRILAEQEGFLRQFGEEIIKAEVQTSAFGKFILDLTRLRAYHPLIRRIVLALLYEKLTGSLADFDFEASERFLGLIESGAGAVDLKRGIVAEAAGKSIYIFLSSDKVKPVIVKFGSTTTLGAFGMKLKVTKIQARRPSRDELESGNNRRVYVDAACLHGKLRVRAAVAGDRFRPLGMKGEKKLSDLFIDRKVDRPLREETPILEAGDTIVWVIGHALGDGVKITDKTKSVLKLEVEEYRGH